MGQFCCKEQTDLSKFVEMRNQLEWRYPNQLDYFPGPYTGRCEKLDPDQIVRCMQYEGGGPSSPDNSPRNSCHLKAIHNRLNHFVCSMCTMIVSQPQECQNCNSLFCHDCLGTWREQHSYCPKMCHGDDGVSEVKVGQVNRYVLTDLHDLQFKCRMEQCDYSGSYMNMLEHQNTCKY